MHHDGARRLQDGRPAPHMRSMLPIEIVGGGVGGLALGLALRRAGVAVTLFEAAGYPRHRVCGEFISGLGNSTRRALGLDPFLADSCPHRGVTYYVRERPLPAFSLPAPAWGISRHTLDSRLASAFVAAGGHLLTDTRVSEAEMPPGRVFAAGRKRRGPFWVGLKVHVRNMKLANDFEVHLGERAYVGMSRVETGAVNVCGIFARRQTYARDGDLLTEYLRAAGLGGVCERLLAAEMDPVTFCASAAPLGDRWVAGQDRIRIGDACASIPPFTGNGLAMALQGAELALQPLCAYARGTATWNESVERISLLQRLRFRRRLLLASFLHPFFLEPRRQSFLAALARSHLIPFRAFYASLH
jgi:2-polyprenyl-6-methoxyphenol hydroxylase-like FAD-dependent oxidoreductase